MTATDPRQRYSDAVEAVDALSACLRGSAVSPELPPQRAFQPNLIAVAAGGGVEAKTSDRSKTKKQNQNFRMLSVPSIIVGVLLVAFTAFSIWRTFSRFEIGSEKETQISKVKEKAGSAASEASAGTRLVGKENTFVLAVDDSLPLDAANRTITSRISLFAIRFTVNSFSPAGRLYEFSGRPIRLKSRWRTTESSHGSAREFSEVLALKN